MSLGGARGGHDPLVGQLDTELTFHLLGEVHQNALPAIAGFSDNAKIWFFVEHAHNAGAYNRLPLVSPVEPDLERYAEEIGDILSAYGIRSARMAVASACWSINLCTEAPPLTALQGDARGSPVRDH